MIYSRRLVSLFSAAVFGLRALFDPQPAVSQTITKPATKAVYASQDPLILKHCPQIDDVQTITVPADFDIDPTKAPLTSTSAYLMWIAEADPVTQLQRFSGMIDQLKTGIVFLNHPGGSPYITDKMVAKMTNTKAEVITVALDYSHSAAFSILLHGNFGKRYAYHKASLMVHETTFSGLSLSDITTIDDIKGTDMYKHLSQSPGFGKISDDKIVAILREQIRKSNESTRTELVARSSTNITPACASALVRDKTDTFILPEVAVRLGFVDASVDHDNGTMTIRANDPRVEKLQTLTP